MMKSEKTAEIIWRKKIRALPWLLLVCLLLTAKAPVRAETKPAAAQEYLTKGDVAMFLSTTDFMKKKIGELLSWTIGYDVSKINRVKLVPSIEYIRAVPRKVPPDGRTVLEIVAAVDDPGGLGNISGVRADLSNIGQISNISLVDNGRFGDEKANDGLYTLQTSVLPIVQPGQKEIPVAVSNKKGWLALAKTNLDIWKNPVIMEVEFSPSAIRADGKSQVTLTVRVDNPGRIEDVNEVRVDLRPLGRNELAPLRNDGRGGDLLAKDDKFTLQFTVPADTQPSSYNLKVEVFNVSGGYATGDYPLQVYK